MYNKLFLILFIISILCYLITNNTKFNNIKDPFTNFRTLVVCVYNEDINWIHDKKENYYKIYIYIKNKNRYNDIKEKFNKDKIEVISIENIGSCDHAYLYHIINNYNDLNGNITFSKGTFRSRIPEYPLNIIYNKNHRINNNHLKSFKLTYWNFTHNKNLKFKYVQSEFKNFEAYLCSIFTKKSVDILFGKSRSQWREGYFTVNSSQIKVYDKEIYQNLISFKDGPNREIDHFHERLWGLLFTNRDHKNIKLLSN
jgi:hypothetical protein